MEADAHPEGARRGAAAHHCASRCGAARSRACSARCGYVKQHFGTFDDASRVTQRVPAFMRRRTDR